MGIVLVSVWYLAQRLSIQQLEDIGTTISVIVTFPVSRCYRFCDWISDWFNVYTPLLRYPNDRQYRNLNLQPKNKGEIPWQPTKTDISNS